MFVAHGVYLIFAGLGLMVLSWVIPNLLVKIVSSEIVDETSLPAVARGMLEHRSLVPLMALPTIAIGIVMLFKVRWRYAWLGLGLVAMAAPAVLLLYVFVVAMGALYNPMPL